MRLKKLFLLLVAMVIAVPTMFAQESTLYVAKTTSKSYYANVVAAAGDPSLTYNAATGAYEGTVTLPAGYAFAFYTGSVSAPHYYGTIAKGVNGSKAVNFQSTSTYTYNTALVDGGLGGWYISRWPDGASTGDGDVKMSVDLTNSKISFEPVVSTEAPTLYLWEVSNNNDYVLKETLEPNDENVYTWSANYANLTYFFLSSTDDKDKIGPSVNYLFSGHPQLTPWGEATVTLKTGVPAYNTNTIAMPAGYYKEITFAYETLAMTVNFAPQLKYATTSVANDPIEPNSADPALTYNPETNTYSIASVTLTSSPYEYLKLYSTFNGDTQILGPVSSSNMATSTTLPFASNPNPTSSNTIRFQPLSTWGTGAQTANLAKVGGWYTTGWTTTDPRYYNAGNTSAEFTITLSGEKISCAGKWSMIGEPFFKVPATLRLYGNAVAGGNINVEMTPVTPGSEVYSCTYVVPEGGAKLLVATSASVSAGVLWQPAEDDLDANSNLATATLKNGSFIVTADQVWDTPSPTPVRYYQILTPGTYKVTLNTQTGLLTFAHVPYVMINLVSKVVDEDGNPEDANTLVRGSNSDGVSINFTSNPLMLEFPNVNLQAAATGEANMNAFFALAPKEGYQLQVVCSTPGSNANYYNIQPASQEESASTAVAILYSDAIGYEFTAVVSEPSEFPETLNVIYASNFGQKPTPGAANTTNAGVLEQVADQPGVYTGTVNMPKGKPFGFSTSFETGATTYLGVDNADISFSDFQGAYVWPNEDDMEQVASASMIADKQSWATWYITAYPKTNPSSEDVTFTVDLNTMSIKLQIGETAGEVTAPEKVYLWGTLGGFTGDARYTNMATLNKVAGEGNVYEVEMVVPKCGPFEADEEYSPSEGDPNDGFYFLLNDNENNLSTYQEGSDATGYHTVSVVQFQADLENHLIDLSESKEFTTGVVYNGTGHNFICVTPGLVKMTFDFDKMQFTAVLLQSEKKVTLTFPNEKSVAEINDLYTIVDMTAIGAGGMEDGMLTITENPYTLSYMTQAGLLVAAPEGYALNIECTNWTGEGEAPFQVYPAGGPLSNVTAVFNSYMVTFLPEADGLNFNITAQESGTVTFKFVGGEGVENAYENVTVTDPATGDAVTLTSDVYTLTYVGDGQLQFVAADGYDIVVACDTPDALTDNFSVTSTESGVYNVTVKAAASGYNFTVVVSKTNGVGSLYGVDAEGRVKVYNLQGVLLLDTDDAANVKALAPGLYIVNGKKVLVK